MKQKVLLLSSVHPATDPRILYKIAPSIAPDYEVFCALPDIENHTSQAGITMIRLPRHRSLLVRVILTHPVLLWKCIRLRPDLVHIFVPELIPVAFLFQWLGAKVIYEVQENLFKKFEIKTYNNQTIFQILFKFFDHAARRHFYCIFTEDAYLKEYRSLKHPFVIVHNYVSLPFIDKYLKTKQTRQSDPVLFYSGVISMERCFDVLVAGLIILKEKYPNFKMNLFGPVRFNITEAQALPGYATISRHLTFFGYTDFRLVIPFASGAVAGIALLKPVADYQDSYTTKLFEYMALKLPVITSDFPLYKDVVEKSDCGFCISPYNANLLAEKITWLIENPLEAEDMGGNGRRAVEHMYNWKNEEKTLLSFYENTLNTKKLAA